MTSWEEKFSKLNNRPGTIIRYPRVGFTLDLRIIVYCMYEQNRREETNTLE